MIALTLIGGLVVAGLIGLGGLAVLKYLTRDDRAVPNNKRISK